MEGGIAVRTFTTDAKGEFWQSSESYIDSADFGTLSVLHQNHDSGLKSTLTISYMQVEEGASASQYHPYHRREYIIPSPILALDGYGWSAGGVYNSIERTDTGWQYVQRVGSFTLDGTEGFALNKAYSEANGNSVFILTGANAREKLNNVVNTSNLSKLSVCADLICVDAGSSVNFISNTIAINGANYYIWIGLDADTYPDATALNAWLSEYPVTVYYAFDKPVTTDITDLMVDFPANFEVEPGGTLTFENTAKLPVPNSVEYLISLAEVTQ